MRKFKVSVIGAGNVGALAAKNILQEDIADVMLVDVVEGLAKGKSIDLRQDSILNHGVSVIEGSSDFSAIYGSDIVAVCAGQPRLPGMTREDLLKKNSIIVKSVAEQIQKYASNSIIITVTNPLDIMSWYMLKLLKIERNKLIGMGGVLDTARYHYYISKELDVSPVKISGMVIGAHGDSMVPLVSQSLVQGKPLSEAANQETINKIIANTKNGGAEIVGHLKTGSAYFAPGKSVALMVKYILQDARDVLPCSVLLDGEYGLTDTFMGVPVVLGRQGMIKIMEQKLTADEAAALSLSGDGVRKNFKELE